MMYGGWFELYYDLGDFLDIIKWEMSSVRLVDIFLLSYVSRLPCPILVLKNDFYEISDE